MRGISRLAVFALAIGIIQGPAIAQDSKYSDLDHIKQARDSATDDEQDTADGSTSEKDAVIAAADAFFEALRNPDKTALAKELLNEAVIFVHDRRNPGEPNTIIVPAGAHLEGWANSTGDVDEYMRYESVLIDGTMAHVWGPYVFLREGQPSHCGINSMSMVRTDDGWRVGNTSFTMTSLDECEPLGAPKGLAE